MGFCVNQLGSREEAEDAVQSTFLNAHRALQRGVEPETELAWLFKIAHNVCLTRRRSSSRRGRVESAHDLDAMQDYLPAPTRESSDELIRLTDALARMPDGQRRAILLREWQGLSYAEIACELQLSRSAVETLIFRARRSLAANLEETPDPGARPAKPTVLTRARQALDVAWSIPFAQGLLSGGAAVKAAAAAVAVTGTAVVATAPSDVPAPAMRAPAVHVQKHTEAAAPPRAVARERRGDEVRAAPRPRVASARATQVSRPTPPTAVVASSVSEPVAVAPAATLAPHTPARADHGVGTSGTPPGAARRDAKRTENSPVPTERVNGNARGSADKDKAQRREPAAAVPTVGGPPAQTPAAAPAGDPAPEHTGEPGNGNAGGNRSGGK